MQFPAAHHPKGVRGVGLLHAQAHVLAPFGQQPLAQAARRHVAPVASGPRRAVHAEDHFDGRLVDAQQRQRDRALAVGNRLTDLHVLNAGHGHDVARGRGGDRLPFQTAPAEHLRHFAQYARPVRAAQRVRLGAAHLALQQPADSQTPDVIVVIQIRDLKLYRPARGVPRPRQRGHDRLEQRLQARAGCIQRARSDPGTRVRVHHRKFDLLLGGPEFDEQIVDFVQHLGGPRVAPVDFVEAHEGRQPGFQGFLEHEARLRQRPFRGVHQQHDAVDHRQRAFDLAAEVGMPGRIHEIDLDPAKEQRRVLGQNGDPAFAFQRERVHHPLDHRRVGAERAALAEQRIDQRRLAVIDVRDDRHVANVTATPLRRLGRRIPEVQFVSVWHGWCQQYGTPPGASISGRGAGIPGNERELNPTRSFTRFDTLRQAQGPISTGCSLSLSKSFEPGDTGCKLGESSSIVLYVIPKGMPPALVGIAG